LLGLKLPFSSPSYCPTFMLHTVAARPLSDSMWALAGLAAKYTG